MNNICMCCGKRTDNFESSFCINGKWHDEYICDDCLKNLFKDGKHMTRFSRFTDDELDMTEAAFCNEGLTYLVDEIRRERRYRESVKKECIDKTQPPNTSWWECEHCGKLIPYMADFCHECANKLLGEPPKPFESRESEENKDA